MIGTVEWKPKGWIAILIGIFLQPFTFLYVNKVRLFWIYFLIAAALGIIDLYYSSFITISLSVICPLHSYLSIKRYDESLKRNWYSRWWGIPLIYLIMLAPIFIIRSFFYEPYTIPASSMSPSVNLGDFIIIKKWGYRSYGTHGISILDTEVQEKDLIKRGNIYVFYPPHNDKAFIKRLVGMPGDNIEIKQGIISINGKAIESKLISQSFDEDIYEETLDDNTYNIKIMPLRRLLIDVELKVPEDEYFFLGDNRDNSSDSRVWGTVPSSDFVGKLVYIY
jgi:signal peptidase I